MGGGEGGGGEVKMRSAFLITLEGGRLIHSPLSGPMGGGGGGGVRAEGGWVSGVFAEKREVCDGREKKEGGEGGVGVRKKKG